MLNQIRIAARFAAATWGPSLAAAADLSSTDQKFLADTAQALTTETQLGEMALSLHTGRSKSTVRPAMQSR